MAPNLDDIRTRPRTRGEARLALLKERGITLAIIARHLERDLSVVSRVNSGQRRSQAIEEEIARQLELSMADAFPEWYRAEASPAGGERPALPAAPVIPPTSPPDPGAPSG